MFIKFGDKTETVVVKGTINDSLSDKPAEDEEDSKDDSDDRRAQILKKYRNKKLHKNTK